MAIEFLPLFVGHAWHMLPSMGIFTFLSSITLLFIFLISFSVAVPVVITIVVVDVFAITVVFAVVFAIEVVDVIAAVTNIVIKLQPESEKTYLVNKDHERVVNPLLPPERRKNMFKNAILTNKINLYVICKNVCVQITITPINFSLS